MIGVVNWYTWTLDYGVPVSGKNFRIGMLDPNPKLGWDLKLVLDWDWDIGSQARIGIGIGMGPKNLF